MELSATHIVIILAGLLGMYLIFTYNKLVSTRTHVREAWSGIDVQLKRRYDLIPNLLNVVKGYAKHEKELFESVVQARSNAMQANDFDVEPRGELEQKLSGMVHNVCMLSEDYPRLNSEKLYSQLMDNLSEIENEIQMARRFYNGTCRDANIFVQSFPTNLVAKQFGFTRHPFFEFTESREVPKMTF